MLHNLGYIERKFRQAEESRKAVSSLLVPCKKIKHKRKLDEEKYLQLIPNKFLQLKVVPFIRFQKRKKTRILILRVLIHVVLL